ncbi:MAG TPA: hypothetical protein VHB77_00280 [Planctomycetaceae bacterium]|nr:hypothetical protein [Planctomycetaceae bacterium]
MSLQSSSRARAFRTSLIVSCAGLAVVAGLAGARKGPIKKPTFDPKAEQVELFTAIEEGRIEAKIIAKSSKEANIFLENKTKKPLSVKMPPAVAAVQVLKQQPFGFAQNGLNANNNGPGGNGNNNQSGGQSMGMGMGMGNGMMGMNGMNGGGMNMMGMNPMGIFSVPAEKVVQVSMKGVCLEHGKAEPTSAMKYRLVPLNEYTSDPVLQETVTVFATTSVDQQVAQAAVWNVANKRSWNELANESISQVGLLDEPMFSESQLKSAKAMVAKATEQAKKRPAEAQTAGTDTAAR